MKIILMQCDFKSNKLIISANSVQSYIFMIKCNIAFRVKSDANEDKMNKKIYMN